MEQIGANRSKKVKKNAGGAFNGLFLGEFDHALDPQGRLTLPKEWRNADGETALVMIPARDRALLLLPVAVFLEFVERARKFAIANAKIQAAFAYLGSRSRECRCDKQGRIALDRKMLESAGIDSRLKLIGAVTHIRICAPENWQLPDDAAAAEYLNEIDRLSGDDGALGSLLEGILKK